MANAPDTSTYILQTSDDLLPNSRILLGTTGSINVTAGSLPVNNMTISPTGALGSLSGIEGKGYVTYDGTSFVTSQRTFESISTITISNPDGVSGPSSFDVNDNTSVQKVGVSVNGAPIASTRKTINFIPTGSHTSITCSDNPLNDASDVYIGVDVAAAPIDAPYVVSTPIALLANSQAVSILPTGIMKSTTTTGIITIATPNVDYQVGSVNLTGIAAASPALGNILVGNGITYRDVGIGAAGTALISNGTIPQWLPFAGDGTVTSAGFESLASTIAISVMSGANPIVDSSLLNFDLQAFGGEAGTYYNPDSIAVDIYGRVQAINVKGNIGSPLIWKIEPMGSPVFVASPGFSYYYEDSGASPIDLTSIGVTFLAAQPWVIGDTFQVIGLNSTPGIADVDVTVFVNEGITGQVIRAGGVSSSILSMTFSANRTAGCTIICVNNDPLNTEFVAYPWVGNPTGA